LDNILFFAILTGAVGHVTWNILLKKSQDKIKFTRAFTLIGSFIMFPILFYIEPLPRVVWPLFLATIFIHVFYKIYLCKVYDYSGLSYGYPIARGLPSLILLALTPILFDESLSISNQLSIIIISLGILLLVFSEGNFKKINIKGLVYSLLVAAIIVAYSTVDAKGARLSNAFTYLIYYFALDGFIFNLISYFIFKKHQISLIYFKKNFLSILAAASCSIYSYIPAVYGFTVGKIAVIAALREVSILFASIYGVFILKEKGGSLALISAMLILSGCIVIKIF
jgi:drug/metabolite transporter (DMT)-like permease